MYTNVVALFCLLAVASAGYVGHTSVGVAYQQVPTVVNVPTTISKVVQTGVSHHPFSVPEHRFSRQDWETPGAVYAIPATKTFSVTRPGFTTYAQGPTLTSTSYIKSSVPVATISKHLAPVAVAAAPVLHGGYGGLGYAGGYGGGYGGYAGY